MEFSNATPTRCRLWLIAEKGRLMVVFIPCCHALAHHERTVERREQQQEIQRDAEKPRLMMHAELSPEQPRQHLQQRGGANAFDHAKATRVLDVPRWLKPVWFDEVNPVIRQAALRACAL